MNPHYNQKYTRDLIVDFFADNTGLRKRGPICYFKKRE